MNLPEQRYGYPWELFRPDPPSTAGEGSGGCSCSTAGHSNGSGFQLFLFRKPSVAFALPFRCSIVE